MGSSKELTKAEKIKKEVNRLKRIYKEIETGDKEGLINEAAYMRIQLDLYRDDLDTNGYYEMFTQSEKTDPYERERPVARLYNTLNKNYQSIMKQLNDMLPKQPPKSQEVVDDGFEKFVKEK